MSKELRVQQYNEGEVRVSHQNLAEFLDLRQGDVRDLIERHIGVFKQIPQCPFQTENTYPPNWWVVILPLAPPAGGFFIYLSEKTPSL